MDKIRKIIKLHREMGLSERAISRALGLSRPVITKYLKTFEESKLDYKEIESMQDQSLLEKLAFKQNTPRQKRYMELADQFEYFVQELKKTGVTLQLLWQEHKQKYPDTYEYSQFCYHFSAYRKQSKLDMHIEQKAGDKLYVDFTGDHMYITDAKTCEKKPVEVFVAILGASQFTYSEAVETQQKHDWIKANTNTLHYIGGVPAAIMPDCLKSGVTRADKYEPDINPEYEDFANHYNTVILPARARKPKDKALAENAVKIIYMRIFAPLRNRVFFSLAELNEAIRDKLEEHNNACFQRLNTTRRQLLEQIDLPALKPLPPERYELKHIEYRKVQFNYHAYLPADKHYYSVPYAYRDKCVKIKYTAGNVEIFYNNTRIASHVRDISPGQYSTKKEHMPSHHRFYAEWSPGRFLNWAGQQGEYVEQIIGEILKQRQHPEQAFRSCLGVLSLHKKYGLERINLACKRAAHYGQYSYKSIVNILDRGLDKINEKPPEQNSLPLHENIRGNEYFIQEAAHE